jgi:hypothetical protein
MLSALCKQVFCTELHTHFEYARIHPYCTAACIARNSLLLLHTFRSIVTEQCTLYYYVYAIEVQAYLMY